MSVRDQIVIPESAQSADPIATLGDGMHFALKEFMKGASSMKVAVPTFGERVSPRFDCAVSLLVATVERGEICERRLLDASDWTPHERINRLVEFGVDVVLCGGIDRRSADSLRSAGVSVICSVTGSIDEGLDSLVHGEFEDPVRILGEKP